MDSQKYLSIFRISLLATLLCFGNYATAFDVGISGDVEINRCETKSYSLNTLNNESIALTNLGLTVRLANLPDFSYADNSSVIELDGIQICDVEPVISGTDLTWDIDLKCPAPVNLDPASTLNLKFDLHASCAAESGEIHTRVDYQSSGSALFDESAVHALQVLPGKASISMSPAVDNLALGKNANWVIKVENTGLGTLKNVTVTDVLNSGLAYIVSTPSGSSAGYNTTIWDASNIPALASMLPGDVININLWAQVIACDNLDNSADVYYGCDASTICYDSAANSATAHSSIQRVATTPLVELTPPDISFGYCDSTQDISLSLTNNGDGVAYNVFVNADFSSLGVANVSSGAVYNVGQKRFEVTDPMAAGSSYQLSFQLSFANWCSSSFPNGDLLWQLQYDDECANQHHSGTTLSQVNTPSGSPSLTSTLIGVPSTAAIGGSVTYEMAANYSGALSCGTGNTGNFHAVGKVPDGFTVDDANGGVWTADTGGKGGTIDWLLNANAVLSGNITLLTPDNSDCGIYCKTSFQNQLTSTITDCCGCSINSVDSRDAVLECEQEVVSQKTVSSTPTERCGTLDYSNTYDFDAVSTAILNGLQFIDYADNQQVFVPDSLSVSLSGSGSITGCVSATDSSSSGGDLSLDFSGCSTTGLAGQTLSIDYRLSADEASAGACTDAEFNSWSSLNLGTIGSGCLSDGIIHRAVQVNIQAPDMSLTATGLGNIISKGEIKTVSLNLTQTSSHANPRDVILELSGLNYFLPNPAASICNNVAPGSCTPTVTGTGDYQWRFNDAFTGSGQVANLQVDVQKRCTGNTDLISTAWFDDNCSDDTIIDKTCSSLTSLSPGLLLSGDLLLEKNPEVYHAVSNIVNWELYLTNRGSGTAYNVWLDDILGSGLIYEHGVNPLVVDNMSGVTITANEDHQGGLNNGVSVAIADMAAGERRQVSLSARLVDDINLTNNATATWTVDGVNCQTPSSDSSNVEIAAPELLNTIIITNPVDACSIPTATVKLKNSGSVMIYAAEITTTLPAGLFYTADTTQWRLNDGSWDGPAASYNPLPANSPMMWNSTQIPALSSLAPGDTLEIQFTMDSDCSFNGGTALVNTVYKNPTATVFNTSEGKYEIAFRAPTISLNSSAGLIACGGATQWALQLENTSAYPLPVVWVEDTFGAAFSYTGSTAIPPYNSDAGFNSGQQVTWELKNLVQNDIVELYLTANSDNAPCSADLSNQVRVWWGCGTPDGDSSTKPGVDGADKNNSCLASIATTDETSTESRVPQLEFQNISFDPLSISACNDSTEITVVIENTGTINASNIDLKATLPDGLSYVNNSTKIDNVVGPNPAIAGNTITFGDIAIKTDNLADSLNGGNDTLILKFTVLSSCCITNDIDLTLYFYDCCDDTQHQIATSSSISINSPELNLTQTPVSASGSCAIQKTWDATITNSGTVNAQIIRIEATPGDWIDISTGQSGDPTEINSSTYAWELNNLPSGDNQVLHLSGTLNPDNQNSCQNNLRQINMRAKWGCGNATDGDPTSIDYACEHSAEINASAVTLTMPDLVITDILPQITGSGQASIDVIVENQGDDISSDDFTIEVTDGKGWTGTAIYSGNISVGTSVTITLNDWTPAVHACGAPYSFNAIVDLNNDICECDESANSFGPVDFTAVAAELAVTALDTSGLECIDGSPSGALAVTLENSGCQAADSFDVNLTSGGCLTFSPQNVLSLAAGSSTQLDFSVNGSWPSCAKDSCRFTAEADPSDVIIELDETDNSNSILYTYTQAARLFWIDQIDQKIFMSNSDGSGRLNIINTGIELPIGGIAVDQRNGMIYWTDSGGAIQDRIERADFSGSKRETLLLTGDNTDPAGIALDVSADRMYWAEQITGRIRTADLDGSAPTTLLSGLNSPFAVVVDPINGKLYWSESDAVMRADLDGSNSEQLATPIDSRGIALDQQNDNLFWSNAATNSLMSANLDGSNAAEIFNSSDGVNTPQGLTLDQGGNRLFWIADNYSVIKVAAVDGSPPIDLVMNTASSLPIALVYKPATGVAPSISTGAPTVVSETEATLNGTANAYDVSTNILFEYGTDTDYGYTVAGEPGTITGNVDLAVSKSLSGLKPNTQYHYRAIASSNGGDRQGIDRNFTTSAQDWGDAPDSYGTTQVNDGAVHTLAGPYLGSCVDWDTDGRPGINADGDDSNVAEPALGSCNPAGNDEDGVIFPAELRLGSTIQIQVIASAPCKLSSWIDFNGNGVWSDVGEQVFADTAITTGSNLLNIVIPEDALAANTYTRFRCTTDTAVAATGAASDGEVEDYVVILTETEISLSGNSIDISDGDTTPNSADYTDFGSLTLGASMEHSFTIHNSGNADLLLTGTPAVTISGSHAADFNVTLQPITTITSTSGSSVFKIRFTPSAKGSRTAMVSIDNDDADENPFNFNIQGSATEPPEISLSGNAITINDDDSTPSSADHTDFGSLILGDSLLHSFTIHNSGNVNLLLTGTPEVAISGSHAADFSIIQQPPTSIAAFGGSSTFELRFTPTAEGIRSAMVSIDNNDADKNPFNFSIQGSATEPVISSPEIGLSGNGFIIADGESTPSSVDHTDFGSLILGNSLVHSFIIHNSGNADLLLTGTPAVTISGSHAADFSIIQQPPTSIAAFGGSSTFELRFTPVAEGIRSAMVSIDNNDADANPFNFSIQGNATEPVIISPQLFLLFSEKSKTL